MADCYLTARQKDMIRSLVSGLQDGTVKTEWSTAYGGGEIMGIFGLDDQGELWRGVWHGVTWADFDEFVSCGYFRQKSKGAYTLRVQMILDAVENNFGEDSTPQTHQTETITITPIWGPPIITRQFQCDVFMLMPFRDEFRVVYNQHIKSVAVILGLEIKLGDDFFSKHDIIKEIWSAIYNSKFVIADCTGKNANVFYELGIAHMLDKPAIMIAQNDDDVPFDVRAKRYIRYENSPEGLQKFEAELKIAVTRLVGELEA